MSAENWVSQGEAARLETLAGRPVVQSSVSRFVERNPDLPVKRNGAGKVTLIEYGAFAEARSQSVSVQDRHANAVRDHQPLVQASRKRALEEEKLELDLAERKGTLISRSAVTGAIEAAGVSFVQAMERRRRQLAQALAGLADARAVELELKGADRALLEALSADLVRAAGGVSAAQASTEAEAA